MLEETKAKVRNFPRTFRLPACAMPSRELPRKGKANSSVAAQKRKFLGRKGGQHGFQFRRESWKVPSPLAGWTRPAHQAS